jgi:hypothetical protein
MGGEKKVEGVEEVEKVEQEMLRESKKLRRLKSRGFSPPTLHREFFPAIVAIDRSFSKPLKRLLFLHKYHHNRCSYVHACPLS